MFESMVSMLNLQGDIQLMYNALAFLLGLGIHIGKKCYLEEITLREYLTEHKLNTTLSAGSLIGVFIYIVSVYPEANLMVFALGGYCVDSLINRAPLTIKRLEKEVKPKG